MQSAATKWYDRRDAVFVEFCVEDSKEVQVKFEKLKLNFSCVGGTDNAKHQNEVDLFDAIDPNESKHKRTDRSVFCCLRKAEAGKSWPRLTKEKTKLNWLSVDFNNWKDWEDDSDEDLSSFDRFSEVKSHKCPSSGSQKTDALLTPTCSLQMMNNMGGEDDLPDVDGADDDESADSDDEKMPDLE
ncbi:prostaglandin E synthase 3 isoform X1 [Denticeps clupeoides]|uniref:prostaglandin E synthase 3 isoform X1 n=1 Tax=Denticeps clupeoides TaxID=299321 RepID=UPI0010A49659|nr:prostaglandin E synthase 3-like isoform X1 [Denticeps clupeoides]